MIDLPTVPEGGAGALIGGIAMTAKVSRQNNELNVEVGPIFARVWATSASGGKVPLDADGRIRLESGDSVTVSVSGFDGGTGVQVRLYSDPILLGRSKVSADGTLSASYEIPKDIENGNHQVVMLGTARSKDVTFGLSIAVGAKARGISPWVIIVPIGLAVIGALLLPVALRRKRKATEA